MGQKEARFGPGGFVGCGNAQNPVSLFEGVGRSEKLPIDGSVKAARRAFHEGEQILAGLGGAKIRLQCRRKECGTGQGTGKGTTKFPSAHAPAFPFRRKTDLHGSSLILRLPSEILLHE